MAIVLFTAKCYDGSGDVVQCVKIASYIEKLMKEKKYGEPTIIVVPDTDVTNHQTVAQSFVDSINPSIQVQTISEFKQKNYRIDCFIEVGYGAGFWSEHFPRAHEDTPCIYMPEYNNDLSPIGALKVKGGFNDEENDSGVIPSLDLLEVNPEAPSYLQKIGDAFEKLEPEIKKYIASEKAGYIQYRESHDFSYQYSHDHEEYQFSHQNTLSEDYIPVNFFLQEHLALNKNSSKSQDILCMGGTAKNKKIALEKLKETLISRGYTKVSFVDILNNQEEVLHHEAFSPYSKEYRVLYLPKVPYSTMQVLPLLANFVGATGDQSFVEAMSAGKLVSYECRSHKYNFAKGYLKKVEKETDNKNVILLAELLMKATPRAGYIEKYNCELIDLLLNDNSVVNELKEVNRNIIANSHYFEELNDLLFTKINSISMALEPINGVNIKQLRQLGANLHDVITRNTISSPQWENRYKAATKILNLTSKIEENNIITKRDKFLLQKQITIILLNKPCWSERPLLNKLLDIISLGIVPVIRLAFFNDKTKQRVNEFQQQLEDSDFIPGFGER